MCDCNSNTCCVDCQSRAILTGTFTRVDGVQFTASMSATGAGSTCDAARANAEENINATLQQFLAEYTPQIVDYTTDINYVTHCGTHLCPSPKQIETVRKYLEKNDADSKAPFSAYTFGNAFTGKETFIGVGNAGPNGEPVDETMYFRWASMTKFVGLLTIAAALEDGIIPSVDTPIWEYIPEVANITTYVSDSTPGDGFDQFGTPLYNQVLTTDPNLGKSITIRNCLQSSTGFGYSFWSLGSLRSNVVNGFSFSKSDQNYIAWLQNLEKDNAYADTITATNNNITTTFTNSILLRTAYPLLCRPGTENIYDTGATFIGAVVGAALQRKGINKTAAEYTQSRIFQPLGMKNSWLNCGSLNPPDDVLLKLTNAYFARKDTSPTNLGSYQKGPNVQYNTIYGVFDPDANGDGFQNILLNSFIQKKATDYLENDKYAGGYDWSGCGPLSEFCKLLKLLVNKGYDKESETIIFTEQTVGWILTGKYSTERRELGLTGPNSGLINLLNPSATWCGGVSKYLDNTDTLPFGYGPSVFTWGGGFGTAFIVDVSTGNYLIGGTQSPIQGWQISTSTAPFQPDINFVWRTLTCTEDG